MDEPDMEWVRLEPEGAGELVGIFMMGEAPIVEKGEGKSAEFGVPMTFYLLAESVIEGQVYLREFKKVQTRRLTNASYFNPRLKGRLLRSYV